MTRTALVCLGPGAAGAFEIRQTPRRNPAADEVSITVAAASVNPIDVRRAEGYGLRLLSLLGAGKFPMVLGNDFAGTVASVGAQVSTFKPGDRVYGVKPTSSDGTHASHILVKAALVLQAPDGSNLQALAAIPYSFVTMWLAVRGAGLTRENAPGRRVLVHGAAGGLGTLALQMLTTWGAKITAIARPPTMAGCLAAGVTEVVDGTKQPFASLGRAFDATLNFATWDDDLALVRCLRDGALGHASTVHPLLGNFDRYGWVRGALKSFSEKKSHRAALPKGTRNYVWTLFRPRRQRCPISPNLSSSSVSVFLSLSASRSDKQTRLSSTSGKAGLAERFLRHDAKRRDIGPIPCCWARQPWSAFVCGRRDPLPPHKRIMTRKHACRPGLGSAALHRCAAFRQSGADGCRRTVRRRHHRNSHDRSCAYRPLLPSLPAILPSPSRAKLASSGHLG